MGERKRQDVPAYHDATELRLARLERQVEWLTRYVGTLDVALVQALPECTGEPGACRHCAVNAELDSFKEEAPDEAVEPVRGMA